MRGEKWQQFIDGIYTDTNRSRLESSVVLFVVKQGGCAGCNADSFRAMRGCRLCSQQTIKRFKGSDQVLIEQILSVQAEITDWLEQIKK